MGNRKDACVRLSMCSISRLRFDTNHFPFAHNPAASAAFLSPRMTPELQPRPVTPLGNKGAAEGAWEPVLNRACVNMEGIPS